MSKLGRLIKHANSDRADVFEKYGHIDYMIRHQDDIDKLIDSAKGVDIYTDAEVVRAIRRLLVNLEET